MDRALAASSAPELTHVREFIDAKIICRDFQSLRLYHPAGPYRDPSALGPESGPEQPLRITKRDGKAASTLRLLGVFPEAADTCHNFIGKDT